MKKLSDMYQEHMDPYEALKAIASNGIVHTTQDLARLRQMILACVRSLDDEDSTAEQVLMSNTSEINNEIVERIQHWGRDPGAVKSDMYNYVEDALDIYVYDGEKCPDLKIFAIIYGPIDDVLTMINDYPVYAKWRLDIGQ